MSLSEIKKRSQTHNSLCECIRFHMGLRLNPIHDAVCRTKAVLANHSRVSRDGWALGGGLGGVSALLNESSVVPSTTKHSAFVPVIGLICLSDCVKKQCC